MIAASAVSRPAGSGGSAVSPLAAALTGTTELAKLAFRRDRMLLPIWVYLVLIGTVVNAYTFVHLYKTAASRSALAASGLNNPALLFLYGRLNGTSVGALTAWRYGVWAALFAALMSIFTVVRHTRANEETGRQELIGSARVGRQAPLFAALLVSSAANAALALLLAVILPLVGLPVAGSIAFALAVGTCGLAFTGVAGFLAQLTSGARAARGLSFAVLGLSFLLRAVGDASGSRGTSWLTWMLPLGWTEVLRPYEGERWWVLTLPCAVFVLGTWLALAVSARRDLGAGLLSDRPGQPYASRFLRGPFSLAWRLQGTALLWWALGFAFIFGVSGAAGNGIASLVGTSGALKNEFAQLGGQSAIVDAYLAALMLIGGLIAAAYGVSAVQRLHSDETAALAEPLLASAVGRLRWGLAHVAVAAAGSAFLLAVAGVTAGLGYGLAASGSGGVFAGGVSAGGVSAGGEVTRMLGAGLAQWPAVLVIVGIAVLAFGVVPRASVAAGWTAFGLALALNLFGQSLKLSHWVLDVSPFTHAPRLPGGHLAATPLLWLSLVFVVFVGVGLGGLRRRDIGVG
jgi:ABC-2 type transport system permease protein